MLTRWYKQIDQFLFQKVELIISHPVYRVILGKISIIGDDRQKILLQIVSYLLILIPIIALSILFNSNSKLAQKLSTKQEIYQLIQQHKRSAAQVNDLKRVITTNYAITSSQMFLKQLKESIDTGDDLKIIGFSSKNINSMVQTNATLLFSSISTSDLMGFIEKFTSRDKIKISRIDIKKNIKNSSLSGSLDLIHYGRNDSAK